MNEIPPAMARALAEIGVVARREIPVAPEMPLAWKPEHPGDEPPF